MQTFQVDYIPTKPLLFSPDGRYLAVRGWKLTLVDTAGGSHRFPAAFDPRSCGHAFIGNGAGLVHATREGKIVAEELGSGVMRESVWSGNGFSALAGASHSDHVFVALLSNLPQTLIVPLSNTDLTQGAPIGEIRDNVRRLVVSADGRWLAANAYDFHDYGAKAQHVLRLWNLGKPKRPKRGSLVIETRAWIDDFALAADGSHIAAVDSFGLTIWSTSNGDQVARSGKHRRTVTAVAFSPTRPVLMTGDNAGHVFLWDCSGNILTRYDWKLGEICDLCFAPDGLRCAAVDASGKVVVWDMDV